MFTPTGMSGYTCITATPLVTRQVPLSPSSETPRKVHLVPTEMKCSMLLLTASSPHLLVFSSSPLSS